MMRRRIPSLRSWFAGAVVVATVLPAFAATTKVTVAVLSLDGDPRFAPRQVEKAYPGHPTGRAIDGVKLAASDSSFELEAAGVELVLRDVVLPDAAALPKVLAELKAARVQHLVADLPVPAARGHPNWHRTPGSTGGARSTSGAPSTWPLGSAEARP